MSLQLNGSVDALSTLFNFSNISDAVSASLQRLSTGKRINSPADNPTAFFQANSFQTQVDSLNVQISSNQNSINLVKTANSALSQVSTLISSIRASAVDAVTNATTNPAQARIDQANIQSALQSISNIAATTQYGSKNLLDGTAGISSAVTDSSYLNSLNIGGSFGGGVTQSGDVALTGIQAATYATAYDSSQTQAVFAGANDLISNVNGGTDGAGGSVTINGQTVTVDGTDTVQTLIDKINEQTSTTGVSAYFSAPIGEGGSGSIALQQTTTGSNFKINESETSALILGAGGTTVAGQDAIVQVTAQTLIGGAITSANVTFTGGQNSTDDGLHLSDSNGNTLTLTPGGNDATIANAAVGSISSNALQFQIGPNAGNSASIFLSSVSAASLGGSAVAGQNLSTLDVTTASGASNAVLIADAAAKSINQLQAQLGGLQTNVLQSAQNVLSSTVQNLQASITSITSVNVAQESANLANLQLIQQAGVAALQFAQGQASLYSKLLI